MARAFDGQRSDNQPIKRTLEEKKKLLRELEEKLAGLKSHTASALRDSLKRRVAELKAELSVRA